ncbi:MAG: helix-turn-helix transcriptional regulator [Planctomycetota bacterium]|jgi:predicted DNA-binding transcriptional regulator AlpA
MATRTRNNRQQAVEQPAALALNAKQAAAMLNVSVRQLWRLNSTGRLPRPIRLGHCVRWRRAELEAFIQAGAPDRETWEGHNG